MRVLIPQYCVNGSVFSLDTPSPGKNGLGEKASKRVLGKNPARKSQLELSNAYSIRYTIISLTGTKFPTGQKHPAGRSGLFSYRASKLTLGAKISKRTLPQLFTHFHGMYEVQTPFRSLKFDYISDVDRSVCLDGGASRELLC